MANGNNVIELLSAGLKATDLRSKVIANNIANLGVPGYRRMDVKFESLLGEAIDSASAKPVDQIRPEIFEPRTTPIGANGNDVSLESEIGELIKNSGRYKTYLRLIGKLYRQMEAAIT